MLDLSDNSTFHNPKVCLHHCLYEYIGIQAKALGSRRWKDINDSEYSRWLIADPLFLYPASSPTTSTIETIIRKRSHRIYKERISQHDYNRAEQLETELRFYAKKIMENRRAVNLHNKSALSGYANKEPSLEATYRELFADDIWDNMKNDRNLVILLLYKHIGSLRKENRLEEALRNGKSLLRGLLRYRKNNIYVRDEDFYFCLAHIARDCAYVANALEYYEDILFFSDVIKKINTQIQGDNFLRISYYHIMTYYYTIFSKKVSYPINYSPAKIAFTVAAQSKESKFIDSMKTVSCELVSLVASEADWQGFDVSYVPDNVLGLSLLELLQYVEESGDFLSEERKSRLYTIYGKHFIKTKQLDKAIEMSFKSLDNIRNAKIVSNSTLAEDCYLRGLIEIHLENEGDAEMYLERGIRLHQLSGAKSASHIIERDLMLLKQK